jgi:hypothetical protein
MLTDVKVRKERQSAGRPSKWSRLVTISKLPDLGVTKMQSSRWQALAALSKRQQDERLDVGESFAVP